LSKAIRAGARVHVEHDLEAQVAYAATSFVATSGGMAKWMV
jgi:hypothetical protein